MVRVEIKHEQIDNTFLPPAGASREVKAQLMQLGHSFTSAVAEGETEAAKGIVQHAKRIKGEIPGGQ